MSGFHKTPLTLAALLVLSFPTTTLAQVIVEYFDSGSLQSQGSGASFETSGESVHLFQLEPATPSRFPGDVPGSLAVTYDSLESTSRFFSASGLSFFFPSISLSSRAKAMRPA